MAPTPSPAPKKKRGNPNFVKGHKLGGRPPGVKNAIKRIQRCADFMEKEGWDLLEELCRERTKLQLGALQLMAAYGYGQPSKSVEFSGVLEAKSLAEFLAGGSSEGDEGTT